MHAPVATGAPASIEMLRRLVAFNTVSRESNLDLIHYARDHLKALGVESRLTFDDERRKANLFATLGPTDRAGIVLSGHTDVVPVEGQPWDTDPFEVVEKDGRLYGRGTADMKGFIAVALTLAPEFLERNLKTPVHLALSYDEEVGCLGVRRLLADLAQAAIRPASCIVGEPTGMKPVIAHKGKKAYRCTVRGHACHSAYAPRGVNAVEAAAEVVAYLKNIARQFRDSGPFDATYDIAYTTVHTGVIRGGTAVNIVPRECTFDFEIRYLPGEDPEALFADVKGFVAAKLLPEMHEVDPATGFEWKEMSVFPVLDTAEQAEIVTLARALARTDAAGKVSFGTEAALFQQAGIPAVVCGPGSIEQAHKPNEYVTLDQLAQCEAFMRRLMERVCEEG
ncbi:MAG: acetylornithine deacetylase [Betaproteobacteria bacterium]|nr:acetylornithine deacetylase [Betaproteobacteria bacterium]